MTISIEGTIPTSEGEMNPTCSTNSAPPMPLNAAAKQNVATLNMETS